MPEFTPSLCVYMCTCISYAENYISIFLFNIIIFSPGDCGVDGCMSTVLHRLRLTLYNIKTYVYKDRYIVHVTTISESHIIL